MQWRHVLACFKAFHFHFCSTFAIEIPRTLLGIGGRWNALLCVTGVFHCGFFLSSPSPCSWHTLATHSYLLFGADSNYNKGIAAQVPSLTGMFRLGDTKSRRNSSPCFACVTARILDHVLHIIWWRHLRLYFTDLTVTAPMTIRRNCQAQRIFHTIKQTA